jgi:hypothetical protein
MLKSGVIPGAAVIRPRRTSIENDQLLSIPLSIRSVMSNRLIISPKRRSLVLLETPLIFS